MLKSVPQSVIKSIICALLLCIAPPPSNADGDPLTIGLIAEMSGSNAANGQSCRRGYEVARALHAPGGVLGAREVHFVYGDHKGEPRSGVGEFTRFLAMANTAAIVTTRAQVAMALNPLSRTARVPLFGTIGHSRFTHDNPYAFQFWPSTSIEGEMLARKVAAIGKGRVALVNVEDEWPLSLAEHFERTLKQLGGRTVFSVTVSLQETDFSSIVARIEAANPDSIFVNMTIAQAGLVVRKLREQGLRQQIISNLYGSFQETVAAAGKESIEGLIFVAPNMNRPKFAEALRAVLPDATPNASAYACYSALSAILAAVESDARVRDGPSLYDAASSLKQVRLLDETLPIVDRQARYELIYKAIRDGRIEDLL